MHIRLSDSHSFQAPDQTLAEIKKVKIIKNLEKVPYWDQYMKEHGWI